MSLRRRKRQINNDGIVIYYEQKINELPAQKQVTNRNNPIVLVVGVKGTGKSTQIKNKLSLISNKNRLIYDIKGEYTGQKPPPIDTFIDMAKGSKDCVVVFEEGSSFFPAARNIKMIELLTGLRHNNCMVFIVFHSLNLVPPYIVEQADFLLLGHTNDLERKIRDKYASNPEVIQAFLELKELRNDPHIYKEVQLNSYLI